MIQADAVIPTTCPYCGVGCQMDLHVRGDQIFRVSGRFNSPVNHGNLCVKGRFGTDFVSAPDRLSRPLVRSADELRPASWDVAMDFTARRLRKICDTHGPEAIGFLVSAKCTNEENYLLQKVARGIIGTNNIDHCARL